MSTDFFDRAAATWDCSPDRQRRTEAFRDAVAAAVPLDASWHVLEYGCGTASLSVALAGSVGRVVAVDSAEGMVSEVRRKLQTFGLDRVTARCLDLTAGDRLAERFDLVVCVMALHHITDIDRLFRAFAGVLVSGGWLCLGDLRSEDGSFHPTMAVPHNGFEPRDLDGRLRKAGFVEGAVSDVAPIRREHREYPVFMLSARCP